MNKGLFGSSWQASQSPAFGSTFNTSAPSTGFSFGSSSSSLAASNNTSMVFGSSGASTGSLFSFTPAAASTNSSTPLSLPQPVFGNSNSVVFGSTSPGNNNDPVSMEYTMAEDSSLAATPSVPGFGQPQSFSTPPSFVSGMGFTAPSVANPFRFGPQQNPSSSLTPGANLFSFNGLFGSTTPSRQNSFQLGNQQNSGMSFTAPSVANPFRFGAQQNPSSSLTSGANPYSFTGQQNPVTPATTSPFQASGILDFNVGGSFSLGSGGVDRSGRRHVKVKRLGRGKKP